MTQASTQPRYLVCYGYSLVELSISLAIIAMLAVGALAFVQKKLTSDKLATTTQHLDVIEQALHHFVLSHGYLPCPSHPQWAEKHAEFGVSDGTYNRTTGLCSGNDMEALFYTGMVPVRTLGIEDHTAYDGWGQQFSYRIARQAGDKSTFESSQFKGTIRVVDLRGNNQTDIDRPAPFNQGAAYIIISHGENGQQSAWLKGRDYVDGTNVILPKPATGIERQNTSHQRATYIKNAKRANFDDIVTFKTKADLITLTIQTTPIEIDKSACIHSQNMLRKASALSSFADKGNKEAELTGNVLNVATTINYLCSLPSDAKNSTLSPIDIAGLSLWLDASDPLGDKRQLTNNSLASGWFDKSGRQHHATQKGNARPRWQTQGLLGNQAFYFDGNNDYLNLNNSHFLGDQSMSLFMVAALEAPLKTNAKPVLFSTRGRNTNAPGGWDFTLSRSDKDSLDITLNLIGSQGSKAVTTNAIEVGSTTPYLFSILRTDNSFIGAVNGQNYNFETTNDQNFIPFNQVEASTIGKGATANSEFNGWIGEVIMYNRGIGMKEVSKLSRHLMKKWNIAFEDIDRNCPYEGQRFRTTASDPIGGCHCEDGYALMLSLETSNACYYDDDTVGKCVPVKDKPDYQDEALLPPTLSQMTLWLDGNDCSTMTVKKSASNPELQEVISWKDKSPQAHVFYHDEGESSRAPIYIPPSSDMSINARGGAYFSHRLKHGLKAKDNRLFKQTPQNGISVFAVLEPLATRDAPQIIIGQSHSNLVQGWSFGLGQQSNSGMFASLGLSTNKGLKDEYGNTNLSITPYMISAIYSPNSNNEDSQVRLYVNGIDDTPAATQAFGSQFTPGALHSYIGRSNDSNHFLSAKLGELLLYRQAKTDIQRQAIEEEYLRPKWNIADILSPAPGGVEDGLSLWLDASDSDTLFTDGDCTESINDSDVANPTIACWKSKRYNAYAKAEEAAKTINLPRYTSNDTALSFDGNDMLSIGEDDMARGALSFNQAYSTIIIAQTANEILPGKRTLLSQFSGKITDDGWALGHTNQTAPLFEQLLPPDQGGIVDASLDYARFFSQDNYHAFMFDYAGASNDGTSITLYKNNVAYAHPLEAIAEFEENTYPLIIGARQELNSATFTHFWQGNIGEILIYRRQLEDKERDIIHNALASKWGISMGGSAPHPYAPSKEQTTLKWWVNANNISPLGNPENGSTVASIKAMKGPSLGQLTDQSQARYDQNAHLGQPGLWLDGVDDFYLLSRTLKFNQHFHLFLSYKPGASAQPFSLLGLNRNGFELVSIGEPPTANIGMLVKPFTYSQTYPGYGVEITKSLNDASAQILAVSFDARTLTLTATLNGTAFSQKVNPDYTSSEINIMGRKFGDAPQWFKGHIFEIIAYNKALKSLEEQKILCYLNHHWQAYEQQPSEFLPYCQLDQK